MSFLEYNVASTPAGWRKILHLNWALVLLLVAVAGLGFLMLFSVAGGSMTPWVQPQMQRFGLGLVLMFVVAMVPIWFWRNLSALAYAVSVILLLVVEFFGIVGMGAQRWIDLGFMRLQPSEMTKITLVMVLAAYYDWLDLDKTSRPIFVILPLVLIAVPVLLTLRQPDLGTALLLLMGGGRGDVPRRRALGLFRRRHRRRRRRGRRGPDLARDALAASAGLPVTGASTPFSIRPPTRSARAITSRKARSRWGPGDGPGGASWKARRAG